MERNLGDIIRDRLGLEIFSQVETDLVAWESNRAGLRVME